MSKLSSSYIGWDTKIHLLEYDFWNNRCNLDFNFTYECFSEQKYLLESAQRLENPEIVDKYARYLEAAKEKLSQANVSCNESSIKHYKQQVKRESSELKRQKDFHQKRIDDKKEVVVKYQQVLSNLDTFADGRIHFEYNLINERVSPNDAKVHFDGSHAQLGWSDYGALAKGHIAGKDMVAAWGKASKLYINAIVKKLVQ